MARINIEETWWTDPRRGALAKRVGSEELADGYAVKLWRVGQEYWKRNKQGIPKRCFDLLGGCLDLLGCGLAVLGENEVYVCGSDEHFQWLGQKQAAASSGGKKSAQRPRDSRGRLHAASKQNPSETKQSPTESSALTPPPPLTPPLTQNHSLKKKFENFQIVEQQPEHADPKRIGAIIDGMIGKLQ